MSDTEQAAPSGSVVKDEPMTDRSHIDPDKHWIGESLPAPSNQDTAATGYQTLAGTSPFPSRANHSHEVRTIFSTMNSFVSKNIPPGGTYLNNLQYLYGRNMLQANKQVCVIPEPGIYEFFLAIAWNRVGGGLFTGTLDVVLVLDSGAYGIIIYRGSMFDIPSYHYAQGKMHFHWPTITSAANVQVRIDHNDVVNWDLRVDLFEITRLHGFTTA